MTMYRIAIRVTKKMDIPSAAYYGKMTDDHISEPSKTEIVVFCDTAASEIVYVLETTKWSREDILKECRLLAAVYTTAHSSVVPLYKWQLGIR